MKRSYSKTGVSRRLEYDSGDTARIELSERGEAVELAERFSAHSTPLASEMPETESFGRAERLLERLRETAGDAMNRAVLAWGSARHELSAGENVKTWSTTEARISIDLDDGSSLHLGGESLDRVSLAPVRRALSNPTGEIAAGEVVLRPEGMATLTRAMIEADRGFIVQGAELLEIDGDGHPVSPFRPPSPESRWPNRFRPSYRRPPVYLPFNAEMMTGRQPRSTSSGSVAILDATVISARISVTMRGADGFWRIRGTPGQWAGSIARIVDDTEWFPLLAGVIAFSAELELDQLEVKRADFGIV